MSKDDETIFRNTTQGWVGAVKIDGRGTRESVPVEPGGTIALSLEEQEMTARAPRNPKDNPFLDQEYEIRDNNTGEIKEKGKRPHLMPDTEDRFIPGAAGSRDELEETGTTTAGGTRGRRSASDGKKTRSRRATPA